MRLIVPRFRVTVAAVGLLLSPSACPIACMGAERTIPTNAPAWLNQPLSLTEALKIALQQNSAILKGKSDLEAAYGVVVQIKAIAIPKLRGGGNYTHDTATEPFPFAAPGIPTSAVNPGEEKWSGNLRLVQSIYEGGRINSSLRTARLTREQALLQYQAVVSDTLTDVRVAYYDILLAAQQIVVRDAFVALRQRELDDAKNRLEAGVATRFEVLRAEVELANARPLLIRARNNHRIAKNNLANLLSYDLPPTVWEDIPLQLTDTLEADPYDIALPTAIGQALERRPELGAVRKAERLRAEGIVTARAGRKTSAELFAGYGARNTSFGDDFFRDVSGWNAGVQMNWDIFDGFLTKGKVQEARALHEKSKVEVDDIGRKIELEVRTGYSQFIEAKEVLDSQKKVVEQGEEALRLAEARLKEGKATQLDILQAQTSLTEARSIQIQALRDYSVARARLERAIGQSVPQDAKK